MSRCLAPQACMMSDRKITRNALQCSGCMAVIESHHRHDYTSCLCGAWSVDGGHDYIKRGFKENPFVPMLDLTTYDPPLEENDGEELPEGRM